MNKIAQLQKRVENNRNWREKEANKSKVWLDRVKTIKEAPARTMNDFWCDKCQADFNGIGYKEIRGLTGSFFLSLPIAWYVGICPVGHTALRRITEKQRDPYYWKSEMVKQQAARMADDLLTPDHPRFKYVYPEQWKKLQTERELLFNHLNRP